MAKEIAVYVSANGNATSLSGSGIVKVYSKSSGAWMVNREKAIFLNIELGVKAVRLYMEEIIEVIKACKIFVAKVITGIPYFALEKVECSTWEFEGKPEEFLDYVLAKEEEKMHMDEISTSVAMPKPVLISEGEYSISIKEIQEKNTELTSKQVLQPVLKKAEFTTLQIICNHVPPWLELDLLKSKVQSVVSKVRDNEIHVLITKS